MVIRRGDIYYADLRPVIGSEQGGTRPVLIVQNDTGNRHSPTVIVAAITSKMHKAKLPTHIELSKRYGIEKPFRNESEKFVLYGLPFFNKNDSEMYNKFVDSFGELLEVETEKVVYDSEQSELNVADVEK